MLNNNNNNNTVILLPPSNHDNPFLMSIAAGYSLLFIIGTCGNAAILAVVRHVRHTDQRARRNTTLTYVCILCIVDFLSMLPLPMTIIDQILGFWMFGTFACKLCRLLEHIGKVFSTFLLVAFSMDRYYAVCHPLKRKVRSTQTVTCRLALTFLLSCAMLSPILVYARSKEYIIHRSFNVNTSQETVYHLYKCVEDFGESLFVIFTLYCFILAYAVPLLLMIFFYYGMLMRLFKQSRAVRQSLVSSLNNKQRSMMEDRIPVVRIAVYTFAICIFHFVCWTPYWASVLYSFYLEMTGSEETRMDLSSDFIYFMYGVHALPYINSASNFILYGLLNKQLHDGGLRSHKNSTQSSCSKLSRQHAVVSRLQMEYSLMLNNNHNGDAYTMNKLDEVDMSKVIDPKEEEEEEEEEKNDEAVSTMIPM